MTEEQCNATKADGEPCTYPAKYEDGRCGVHTETGETEDSGRPSKFTDERAQEAIKAARKSKSEAGCGRAAGVSHTTIQRWKEENPTFTTEDGEVKEFRAAFRRARHTGEDVLIQRGLYDPDVDSSMAKFLLASSFDYVKAEKREMEHSGEIDGFNFTIDYAEDD